MPGLKKKKTLPIARANTSVKSPSKVKIYKSRYFELFASGCQVVQTKPLLLCFRQGANTIVREKQIKQELPRILCELYVLSLLHIEFN